MLAVLLEQELTVRLLDLYFPASLGISRDLRCQRTRVLTEVDSLDAIKLAIILLDNNRADHPSLKFKVLFLL